MKTIPLFLALVTWSTAAPEKAAPPPVAVGPSALLPPPDLKPAEATDEAPKKIAPKLEPASTEEVRRSLDAFEKGGAGDLQLIRRGLISDQTYDRARCAQCLIRHGGIEDVPYLIDALSDDSSHVGALYSTAGMDTTRYWANVALIVICKTSLDFQWDAPAEKRAYAISQWQQHWHHIKPGKNHEDQ